MGGFFEGKPYEYFNNLPQYQQDLQANVSGLASQQLGQPNTAMPAQMYQDVMRAYGVPNSAYGAMNIINAMMGMGQSQTNPFSTFQPTGQPIDYSWDSSSGSGDGSGRAVNPGDGSWPSYNFDSGVGVDLYVDDDGNPIAPPSYFNPYGPKRDGG